MYILDNMYNKIPMIVTKILRSIDLLRNKYIYMCYVYVFSFLFKIVYSFGVNL